MIAAVLLCAVTTGIGVVGVVASGSARTTRGGSGLSRVRLRPSMVRSVVVAGAAGVLVAVATGWPVAFVITAMAVYGLPKLFRRTSGSVPVAKIEAIATWTEMLQGTLAASAGLGQAIVATAPLSPPPIRDATLALSARISAGMHPREALLLFGDQVGDPCADRVICSLLLAVTARAQRLGDLLASLAESTREEVGMRLRIETSRASVRSSVRTVLVFSVAFAGALLILAHSYLAPFGSATGQLVLGLVGILYGTGLTLMVVLARPPAPVRLIGSGVEVR